MVKQYNANNIILVGFLSKQLKSTISLYFATYKKSFQKTVKVIFYLHLGFFKFRFFLAGFYFNLCYRVSSYSDFLALIELRIVGSSEVPSICFPIFNVFIYHLLLSVKQLRRKKIQDV